MTIQQHLEKLNQLSKQLQPWQGRFNEIQDILSLKKPLLEQVERFNQEEQTLNIAIMGQVKAGKSSFLNALLFNGKPVLPTAATPKTANLTRISYGEKPVLKLNTTQQRNGKTLSNWHNNKAIMTKLKWQKN